jgi:hypothetical protein
MASGLNSKKHTVFAMTKVESNGAGCVLNVLASTRHAAARSQHRGQVTRGRDGKQSEFSKPTVFAITKVESNGAGRVLNVLVEGS